MRISTRLLLAATLITAPLGLCGCQALAWPALMWGKEPTKTVPAEYTGLAGKKVCVVVWADSDTLFEYQWVQLEVSEFVAAALKGNVKGITFAPQRSVVDMQRADKDWDRKPPARIGARFDADRVLMVELTQYTTREPGNPHLYRAHIAANIKIYETADFEAGPVYKTTIETVHPSGSAGEWGSSEDGVRKAGMEAFGADVAAKFYERQVKIK